MNLSDVLSARRIEIHNISSHFFNKVEDVPRVVHESKQNFEDDPEWG